MEQQKSDDSCHPVRAPPQGKVQSWRDYFLQNHHIVFIRNDPDGPSSPDFPCKQSKTLQPDVLPDPASSSVGDVSDLDSCSSEDLPHSSLYARKTAVEIFLADQRQALRQVHRQEIIRVENNWQVEVSRHVKHIERLLNTVSQLEKTVAR